MIVLKVLQRTQAVPERTQASTIRDRLGRTVGGTDIVRS